jgi:hypothetical protein
MDPLGKIIIPSLSLIRGNTPKGSHEPCPEQDDGNHSASDKEQDLLGKGQGPDEQSPGYYPAAQGHEYNHQTGHEQLQESQPHTHH